MEIMKEFTPEEAKTVKDIIAIISRYPESVRVCLAAHDSKGKTS